VGASDVIEVSEREGVALLRLAHGKANAMSLDFCEALTARFAAVSSARAVVLTGTGAIFSAGVDLVRLLEGGAPYIRKFLPALSRMFVTIFSHPAPVVAAINGHAIAGGCVLACTADRRLMARDGGRIGVTELLVGVPFPPAAMEIMRCATAPQFFAEAIFGGATYSPIEAVGRGWIHDLVEPEALLDRALETANALAALPAKAFALSKRQTREPALERMQNREIDAVIEEIWTAPETLGRVRDYVARTLRK
jgi:enoyl-CoA hydratase